MVFDQRAKNLKVKSFACRRAYIAFCTAHGCFCQSPMAPARRKILSPPAPTYSRFCLCKPTRSIEEHASRGSAILMLGPLPCSSRSGTSDRKRTG